MAENNEKMHWSYWLHLLIGGFFMFGFPMLDPIEPLTEIGMTVLGVFIGMVYLWSAVDSIWPSMLGLMLVAMAGYVNGATGYAAVKALWMEAWGAEQGTIIYNGYFPGVTEVLSGKEAAAMNTKINNISSIAKSFTIDYLSGKKTNADWNAYIKSLEDNGIKEVYEFYAATATVFMTEHKEGVYSMSALID